MIGRHSTIKELVEYWAAAEGLPSDLLFAVIWHESCAASEGKTPDDIVRQAIFASRPEPGFYGFYLRNRPYSTLAGYKPRSVPNATGEKLLRSQSYGLTQIMGETARVLGFSGQYLNELFEPYQNIKYGAKWLGKYYRQGCVDHALLRYNGGGNKKYPSMVKRVRESGRWKTLLNY